MSDETMSWDSAESGEGEKGVLGSWEVRWARKIDAMSDVDLGWPHCAIACAAYKSKQSPRSSTGKEATQHTTP